MSLYAIADLHLSFQADGSISKPMDRFGERWSDHHIRLRVNWISAVKPEDTVIVAGDISWALKLNDAENDFEWLHDLPGTKVITRGNHDLWWHSITKMNDMYEDIIFLQNRAYILPGDSSCICGTRGWICPGTEGFDEHDMKIYQRELMRLRFSLEEAKTSGIKDIVCALHYPPTNDRFQDSGFTDMLAEYGVKTCVYGHLHGKNGYRCGFRGELGGVDYKLVSLDYLNAVPVKIRE